MDRIRKLTQRQRGLRRLFDPRGARSAPLIALGRRRASRSRGPPAANPCDRLAQDRAPRQRRYRTSAAVVALHLGCLGSLWTGVSPVAIAVAAALYVARMFALSTFYHRCFSHRTSITFPMPRAGARARARSCRARSPSGDQRGVGRLSARRLAALCVVPIGALRVERELLVLDGLLVLAEDPFWKHCRLILTVKRSMTMYVLTPIESRSAQPSN